MSIQRRWPAVEYDFREDGVSFRALQKPVLGDVIKVCDHYDEMLELYGKEKDNREHYELVKDSIAEVRNQVAALFETEQKFQKRMKRIKLIQDEFDILKAGDLDTDPERTPQKMHDRLIDVEGQYIMMRDAIDSYKKQLRMLENSVDPGVDKKRFY